MLDIRKISFVIAAAGAAVFAAALGAQAATVTFYDVPSTSSGPRGTLECTNSGCAFEALKIGNPVNFDTAIGGLFNPGPGRDVGNERAFANNYRKAGDTELTGGTRKEGTSEGMTFTTSALYVVLKIGGGGKSPQPDLMLIRNISGAPISFTWNNSGKASGLSHYTEFGSLPTPAIPLPAAGWLLLGSLGALGVLRRRKHSAA